MPDNLTEIGRIDLKGVGRIERLWWMPYMALCMWLLRHGFFGELPRSGRVTYRQMWARLQWPKT